MAQQSVTYPTLGLNFTVPVGWMGREGEDAYLMGHNSIPGFIMLAPHQYNDLDVVRGEAQKGIREDGGTNLQATTEMKPFGENGLAADFEGTLEGEQARAYVISLVSPHGGGVTIMAVTNPGSFSAEHQKYAEEVAMSVEFAKSVIPAALEEWKQWLSGSRLTYLTSYSSSTPGGGGYSQTTVIDLCPQGFFNYRDTDVNTFGQYAGSHGKERGGGNWELGPQATKTRATLFLNFYDGHQYSYDLSYEDNKLYLNDRRFFRTGRDAPVQDHIPDCW